MAKRGRPRYPDILTPREWEVLALLREELSNEQIARRLDITERTAKYHVAEILGKLGVGSRQEAAAWEPERRPWWMAAGAPIAFISRKLSFGWLSPVTAGLVVVAAVAGVGLLVWGLVQTRGGEGGHSANIATLDDVYARLKAAVTRPGQVLHTTRHWSAELSTALEDFPMEQMDEVWLDAEGGFVRQSSGLYEGEAIVQGSIRYGAYDAPPDSEAARVRRPVGDCHGRYEAVLTVLLACNGHLEDRRTSVDADASLDGRSAIEILTTGTEVGDWRFEVTEHVYLDAESFLPLATTTQSLAIDDDGEAPNQSLVVTFVHEFVDSDTLPADFFELASIGAVDVDPAAGLNEDAGVEVYWLERDLPAEGGRPGLMLQTASVLPAERRGSDRRVTIMYDDARQFGRNLVWLNEWRPEEWDLYLDSVRGPNPRFFPGEGLWWTWPCTGKIDESLDGGRAEIFSRVRPQGLSDNPVTPPPCTEGQPDEFRAHVYLNGVLIIVTTVPVDGNPYATQEGMRQIVRGLVAYTP